MSERMAAPDQSAKPKLLSAIESDEIRKRSAEDYRALVREKYDGVAGKLTAVTGFVTGHEALAGRLIRPGEFDVRGCHSILDAGCGNGRYSITIRKHNHVRGPRTFWARTAALELPARDYANSLGEMIAEGYIVERHSRAVLKRYDHINHYPAPIPR